MTHGSSGTTVTAVPNTGYHFVQWSDGVLTAARTDTNVLANLSVTASFAMNTYTLTYTAGPNGTITGMSPQTVAYGGNGLAVSAVPNSGYQFAQWSDGSTANPRTDSSVTANISVTAAFSSAGVSPTVLVQSPNGGEQLFSGSAYVITWTAQAGDRAIASFDVEYSTNDGGSYVPVPGCTGLGAASRQCTWAAPVTTPTGRVRVTSADVAGLRGADASNATFNVVSGSASVMITGPTNGTVVLVGSVAPITWTHNVGTSAFAPTFTIEISRNGTTGPWDVLAIGVPQASATTGRYDWTVVEPVSTRVRFRVRPTNFTVVGTSGGNVTIASPSLVLAAPLSGETWTISRKVTFRWTTTLGNTETVRVEISRDAGATWNTVAASVVASDGKFTWTVTGPATTLMRARVTWNRNGALSSASTGNNTIR